MNKVKVMVLAGEGINCEVESARAFEAVGAEATIVYIQEWKQKPEIIREFQILVLPGGFSYGDELHSGQILALDMKYSVGEELKSFIQKRGLILGICNGFQILMKLGIFETSSQRNMTLFHNASFKFQDRWVSCKVPPSSCIWTKGLTELSLPVRHGEGRIVIQGSDSEQKSFYNDLTKNGQVALTYTEDINGSYQMIAGLTDTTGQVLGLMPHPEAALESWLYPKSYAQDPKLPLTLFKNAVSFVQENL